MQIIVCKSWHLLHSSCIDATQPKLTTGATNLGTLVQKAVRVMKLTAFFILATCLHVNATDGYGQKVTLSEREVHIEKILNEIKKQTGFNFLYTSNVLANTHRVTVNVTNVLVTEVLDIIVAGQGLEYRVKGEEKLIIIKQKQLIKTVAEVQEMNDGPIDVSGRVTDNQGRPLAGANIKIKGSSTGVITDANGRFTLRNVDENALLEISFVGHDAQTITIRGKSLFNIVLNQKISLLDETVVIAYGTTTRRLSTGNVSTVKAKDIELQPVNNPLLALQGRVPGVTIEQATGMPGAGVRIRVQGGTSLSNGNEPLYIIDGVPYPPFMPNSLSGIQGTSERLGSLPGNPLTYINPLDIESIDILKDADATAIYGSRAANGAVLITTKRGKAGKTTVDVNCQQGWSKVGHFVKLLNTEQYLEMRNEAYFANDGLTTNSAQYASQFDINGTWDKERYTDWQKTLIGGTAQYSNVQLAVSGGTTNTNFRIGGGYNRVTTVFPGDFNDKKSSIQLNVNHSSSDQRFRLQITGSYLANNNNLMVPDLSGPAIELPPLAPTLYNEDGSLNWSPTVSGAASTWNNPLSYIKQKFNQRVSNLTGNATIGYRLLPGLNLQTNLGYNQLSRNEIKLTPLLSIAPELRSTTTRSSSFGNTRSSSWIIEPQLSYQKKSNWGQVELLLGSTFLENEAYIQEINASGFSTDLLMEDILSATTVTPKASSESQYKYNALFGRLNYNWQNKYIVNLAARRDGSSRFGSENLFNNFGSVAFAWLFSNEKIIQKSAPYLSFGKLRASYGTTGNDQIGDYRFMNIYFSSPVAVPYQAQAGLSIFGISNPYLQWEETSKMQIGLDLGFIKDRILMGLNYYRNRSSNQLQSYALPIMVGVSSININFPAVLQNSGWEFSLNTSNIQSRDFTWSSSFNLSIPRNKLVEYKDLDKSTYASTYVIGRPVSLIKRYHLLNVDPATGLFIFQTEDGNTSNNPVFPKDAIVWFNSSQSLYGGLQNKLQYKGFALDFLFQFVKQRGTDYSFGNLPGYYISGTTASRGNQPVTVMDRWQKPGDITFLQRFSATYPSSINNPYNRFRISDAAYRDISYIRLKNVSFSWQLPQVLERKMHVQSVRVFAQGQNLLTITDYIGLDPESGTNTLPPLRTLTIGVQMTF